MMLDSCEKPVKLDMGEGAYLDWFHPNSSELWAGGG